jgi:hypothetical protein
LRLGRTEVPAPATDAKFRDWRAICAYGLKFGLYNRKLLNAIVAERREAEEDLNCLSMRVGD